MKPMLTPRQRCVVAKVARGKRNKTIAHEIGTTETTIKNVIQAACARTRAANRVQLSMVYLASLTRAEAQAFLADVRARINNA